MENISFENITVNFLEENNNVRINTGNETIVLVNQSSKAVSEIIKINFDIVNNYLKSRIIDNLTENLNVIEINKLSMTIVLHYLYMYNSWKNTYKNKSNQDLNFNKKDFDNPSTADIIIRFYKKSSPEEWEKKSSILLGMTSNKFQEFYRERQKYYSK
jgi:hypothetical protein